MKQSVLVVDDEPATRYLLRILLENVGFDVEEAPYGLEALEKARQKQPDVLIFDVKQADAPGFAVCKPAAASTQSVLPIIMLTAKTHWGVFREILRDTMMQFLPKPVGGQDLIRCIQETVAGSLATGSLAASSLVAAPATVAL